MTAALFDVITVHCFFALRGCKHVVTSVDPIDAHDRMEEHYSAKHGLLLSLLVGRAS